MMLKSGFTPEGFTPYTVYPLEGVWGLIDPAVGSENKDNFSYTLMMLQSEFVIEEIAARVMDIVRKKKPKLAVDKSSVWRMVRRTVGSDAAYRTLRRLIEKFCAYGGVHYKAES